MKVHIPAGLKQWYDTSVILSREVDRVILIRKEGAIEAREELAQNMPKETLTPDQNAELLQIVLRPSPANIEPSGDLLIPTYLEEWLQSNGELRFRGNNEQILIDRSICLCPDPTCGKCLLVTCEDANCPVHNRDRKAVLRSA